MRTVDRTLSDIHVTGMRGHMLHLLLSSAKFDLFAHAWCAGGSRMNISLFRASTLAARAIMQASAQLCAHAADVQHDVVLYTRACPPYITAYALSQAKASE
eukprot:6189188-Pleurochrysis_carterae.AAC.1